MVYITSSVGVIRDSLSRRDFNLTAMHVFPQPHGSEDTYRVEMTVAKQFKLFDPVTGQPPTGYNTTVTKDTWYWKGCGAASCSLAPCLRTYRSTVEAGKLHETRVSTSNSTMSSWGQTVPPYPPPESSRIPYVFDIYLAMIDTMCLSAFERQGLSDADYHLDPSTRWLPYNLTFNPSLKNQSMDPFENFSSNASFPESMMLNEVI